MKLTVPSPKTAAPANPSLFVILSFNVLITISFYPIRLLTSNATFLPSDESMIA